MNLNKYLPWLLIMATPCFSYAQSNLPYQLNDELTEMGDVLNVKISPDSEWAVYLADQNEDGVDELFSVPIDGGLATRLNPDLVLSGDVRSFLFSPESDRVLYLSDQTTDEVIELYSVPISGGDATRLNSDLVFGGNVKEFQISPNNERVIFLADQRVDALDELFSVPLAGGNALRLNPDLIDEGDVNPFFKISKDSSRVVYSADRAVDEIVELFSTPLTGGNTIRLNADLSPNASVSAFSISPDSAQIVYFVYKRFFEDGELFSASIIRDKEPVILDSNLGDVNFNVSGITPDSSRFIYLLDHTLDGGVTNRSEILSVSLAGGDVVRLYPDWAQDTSFFRDFAISSDSQHIVYLITNPLNFESEMFSESISGGPSIPLLDSPLVATSISDSFVYFKISPDSKWVVYSADLKSDGVHELFSTSIGGGDVLTLNPDFIPGGDVNPGAFDISSDSSQVIYIADQIQDESFHLFGTPIDGGKNDRIDRNLPSESNVDRFLISKDSQTLVYLSDRNVVGQIELFARRLQPESDETCFVIKTSAGTVLCIYL